jgi:DNA repair exonuclease SbcCD ATPase subunit
MKTRILILITTLCLAASSAVAAEKNKAVVRLDMARTAIETMATKIGDNREAAADLELGRAAIKKGAETSENGRQLFGFGDIKPEAEHEIEIYAEIAELSVAAAASRLEKARATGELEVLDRNLSAVKAKIKIFDDRKSELEKCKEEAARCQGAAGEIEALKAENNRLTAQLEKLQAEVKSLKVKKESTPVSDLVPTKEKP